MSLPRRPSVGLPPTPRARSFTAAPARQDFIPRPRSAASEQLPPSRYNPDPPPLPPQARALRPARSIAALPARPTGTVRSRSVDRRADPRHGSSHSEPPPPLPFMPALPTSPRSGLAQGKRNVPMHAAARSVDFNAYRPRDTVGDPIPDSSSSSGASDASAGSPPSSRTSLNEGDMEDKTYRKPPAGFGSSLWGNITGVASNLTISVSKAWATNVATYSGEETPAGGESRLTRAMKAYHIEKARDPADLPHWLFDERERGMHAHRAGARAPENRASAATRASRAGTDGPRGLGLSRSVTTVRHDEAEASFDGPPSSSRIARGPTLADRKASPAAESVSPQSGLALGAAGGEAHVTKSIARLRALRDAKRNARVRFGDEPQLLEEIAPPSSSSPPRRVVEPPSYQRLPAPTRPRVMAAPALGASLGVRGRQPSARVGLPTGVRPVRA